MQAVAKVIFSIAKVFVASETAAAFATAATSLIFTKTFATLAALSASAAYQKANRPNFKANVDRRREVVVRSAIEPRTIVYGQVLNAGVLTYANVAGTDNRDMWIAITHAGHEVNDIKEVWFDDNQIAEANISWGGGVTGGDYYIGGTAYVNLYRNLGTAAQTVIADFDSAFTDISTAHRGRGCAYTVSRLRLVEASEKIFEAGAPSAIRALMEGKKCYDPRLDTSYGNDPDNASYIAYTTNPILIVYDLMRDSLGLNVANAKLDWTTCAEEADFCDQLVPNSTAGQTEKRFTCNTVLVTADDHATNIGQLLTACMGRTTRKNGVYAFHAGRYGMGANDVTNGTFDADIVGWSNGDAARGSVVYSSGQMLITNIGAGGGIARAVWPVTTVIGDTYCAKVNVGDSSDAANYGIGASNNSNGDSPHTSATKTNKNSVLQFEYVATATTTYLTIYINSATDALTFYADDVEHYLVAERVVTPDYLRADMAIQTGTPKNERFNSARAFYISSEEEYKSIQSLEVENTAFVTRDDGEALFRDFQLACTDTEDEAQRILHKLIQATDEQTVVILPCNYKALDIAIGDRVMLTFSEQSWTNKIFRVINWRLVGADGGVDLTLREDSVDAWEDPDQNDYSTRTATGAIVKATPEVPVPTSVALTARSDLPHMQITWVNPAMTVYWDTAQVFRHTSAVFGSATLIWEGRANSYIDTTVTASTTYYYWVRMKQGAEVSSEVATTPTNSAAAAIAAATATNVEWTGVLDGSSLRPSNNATVGGQLGTNITDEGSSAVNDIDALNTFVLTTGGIAANYNGFMDISRIDDTPAGFYIGQQTGGPAARTALIGFEDATNKVMKIESGSPRPLILTTAMPIDVSAQYNIIVRAKADAATTLNITAYTFSAISLGTDIVTFCTSPSGNDGEVATATREHTLGGAIQLSLTTSYAATNSNWLYPWLDSGNDVGTTYNHQWVAFGMQRDSGATDTAIYIDTFFVWTNTVGVFSGSGAP